MTNFSQAHLGAAGQSARPQLLTALQAPIEVALYRYGPLLGRGLEPLPPESSGWDLITETTLSIRLKLRR